MRLLSILFFIITVDTEAKRRRTGKPRHQIAEERNQQEGLAYRRSFGPNDDKFMRPVPFGHIFKEGFEDPRSDLKQTIDLMELDTVYVKDGPYAREFIKNRPTKFQKLGKPPKKIAPKLTISTQEFPRDDANVYGVHGVPLASNKNISIRPFWNIEGILTRNLEEPPKYRIGGGQMPKVRQADQGPSNLSKSDYFSQVSYGLLNGMEEVPIKYNFTSCDEFAKRARFHPNDVVNMDWVPFYIWTYELTGKVGISRVHQFSFPTRKFVKTFKEDYGTLLSQNVDWEQPKLLMKHGTTEALLIATDRSGQFQSIPYLNLPKNMNKHPGFMKIPMTLIRMKIVDPYLALMYCDHQYAVIMAISGSEPSSPRECISEAATLKLTGKGFPVKRDVYMEGMEARAKLAADSKREQEKFINIEDQMEASRARFKR